MTWRGENTRDAPRGGLSDGRSLEEYCGLGDFAYDTLHWIRQAGSVYRRPRDLNEAEFRLRHYCHRIEKAILFRHTRTRSFPAFAPAFLGDLFFWLDHRRP